MCGTPALALCCVPVRSEEEEEEEEEEDDESGTVLFVQCRTHGRDAVGRVLGGCRVCFFLFPLKLTPCRRCSISVPNACVSKNDSVEW